MPRADARDVSRVEGNFTVGFGLYFTQCYISDKMGGKCSRRARFLCSFEAASPRAAEEHLRTPRPQLALTKRDYSRASRKLLNSSVCQLGGENDRHLILSITVSGEGSRYRARSRYFFARYRYVPDKSPECGLRARASISIAYIPTHLASWAILGRRLRFFGEHENPARVSVTASADPEAQ